MRILARRQGEPSSATQRSKRPAIGAGAARQHGHRRRAGGTRCLRRTFMALPGSSDSVTVPPRSRAAGVAIPRRVHSEGDRPCFEPTLNSPGRQRRSTQAPRQEVGVVEADD